MDREVTKAAAWGLGITLVLAALIVIGSRNLAHFDAVLVGYTFSVLFATFGLTYRYVMWLQRPPTGMYWRRGWQAFFKRGFRWRNLGTWLKRVGSEVLANRFIFKRNRLRGLTHMLIMWGCIIAVLITFPLVFGWLYFAPVPGEMEWYRVVVFGFPTFAFPVHSALAFFMFHGLVWSSHFRPFYGAWAALPESAPLSALIRSAAGTSAVPGSTVTVAYGPSAGDV